MSPSNPQRRAAIQRRIFALHTATNAVLHFASDLLGLEKTTPRLMHTSILTGQRWLDDILSGHPDRCRGEFGMSALEFALLWAELTVLSDLTDSRTASTVPGRRGLRAWRRNASVVAFDGGTRFSFIEPLTRRTDGGEDDSVVGAARKKLGGEVAAGAETAGGVGTRRRHNGVSKENGSASRFLNGILCISGTQKGRYVSNVVYCCREAPHADTRHARVTPSLVSDNPAVPNPDCRFAQHLYGGGPADFDTPSSIAIAPIFASPPTTSFLSYSTITPATAIPRSRASHAACRKGEHLARKADTGNDSTRVVQRSERVYRRQVRVQDANVSLIVINRDVANDTQILTNRANRRPTSAQSDVTDASYLCTISSQLYVLAGNNTDPSPELEQHISEIAAFLYPPYIPFLVLVAQRVKIWTVLFLVGPSTGLTFLAQD
ncbi:hypothetical protein C8R44DRAFT_741136 [Mycena epipterygia]|nr:hypothetical protein C8R44DRAFT_741136 [Mycena epipterygia]